MAGDDATGARLTGPVPDVRHRAALAARAAADKQGDDIVVLDVGSIISITDAFVIASASKVFDTAIRVTEAGSRRAASMNCAA